MREQVNPFIPYHFRTCLQVTSITSIEALAGSECHDFNPAGVFILSHKNAKIPVQPEGGVSMESDFINVLNELMCDEEPDLPTRLHWQEAALNDLTCNNHALGKWFENNSVLYVLSAFKLSDRDFASVFPKLKTLSSNQREQIVRAFEDHIEQCPRCFRKRSYDLEFEARLESTLNENRDFLLKKLSHEDADKPSDEEHMRNGKTRSAHH